MRSTISVQQAQRLIEANSDPLEPQLYPLLEAIGLVLAEAAVGDVDMPPFDKSAVDGVALRSADAAQGAQLDVVDELLAGSVPSRGVGPGEAIRIMTGAPLPEGADAVVMVEQLQTLPGNRIALSEGAHPGQNICRRAEDVAAGASLLPVGTRLQPRHVGLLAGQGCIRLTCYRRPRVAVLATGTELVSPAETPGDGQIRNSNSIAAVSSVIATGAMAHDLGSAGDDEEELREAVRRAMTQDVVLLSGGVSAGVRDLVPGVLAGEGVETVFHHVAMQPGKPVFYGTKGTKHVFGLPGNPVSAFVCFEVLVRPLLRRLMGIVPPWPQCRKARWEGPDLKPAGRDRFIGVSVSQADPLPAVEPVASRGSADLMGLARSEALALIQAGRPCARGETIELLSLSRS